MGIGRVRGCIPAVSFWYLWFGAVLCLSLLLWLASLTDSPVLRLSDRHPDVSVKGEEDPEHIYID